MHLIVKKYKSEILGILFLMLISIILIFIRKNERNLLDEKGLYVLAKLFSSSSEGEISWVYDFVYMFDNKTYHRKFTGPIPPKIKNDSLMFLKLLPENPSVCQQLEEIDVPECLKLENVPQKGWDTLPACPTMER